MSRLQAEAGEVEMKIPEEMLKAVYAIEWPDEWVEDRNVNLIIEAALSWLDKELEEMDKEDRDLQISRVRALWK